jgi:hypothetical protein
MTDLNPVDAMTTDYRALCAELLEALEIQLDELRFNSRLCIRARALLAQPEPEGPTDDKLLDIALATDLVFFPYKGRGCASPYMEGTDITAEVLAYARAVLAKWGHQ